ncbi:hypothetical protein LCGC14_0481880 [marine sediment metagenome]|uniref:Uncharacterized protein n=1 Tax=marine sediment metagenome TaxID=412755 RepID=A0A0F9VI16_9ZZZZ
MKTISKALMTMTRQTKGAVVYDNVKPNNGGQAITTLYLRKDGLTEPYPGSIEVTVAVDDPDEG